MDTNIKAHNFIPAEYWKSNFKSVKEALLQAEVYVYASVSYTHLDVYKRQAVQQASVAELPFEAEQFEIVTAFETVYFWPELAQNFREVYRVLKLGGTFFICNEANGETTKDDKWTKIIDGMTIYTDTALKAVSYTHLDVYKRQV